MIVHQFHVRRGAVLVETVLVLILFMMLLLGIVLGGMAIMHRQMVTAQACELARYAVVRGSEYQRLTELDSPTESEMIETVIVPMAHSMVREQLSVTIEWINAATQQSVPWNHSSKAIRSISSAGEYITNLVRVTVQYEWNTGFGVPMVIRHVIERPMLN